MAVARWERLGEHDPTALVGPRTELHHAVQLVTYVGRSLLPARPDDSQTSFHWLESHRALAGEPVVATDTTFHAALRVRDLTLLVLDSDEQELGSLELAGHSPFQAFEWLKTEIEKIGGEADRLRPELHFEIPSRNRPDDAPFRLEPDEAYTELGRWYGDGFRLFATLAREDGRLSAIRCWPHHFDVGALVDAGRQGDGELRTIGVGLSPGDDSYAEPYLYVTPSPVADDADFPELPHGAHWHRDEWTGAVLTASRLVHGDGDQSERAEEFVRAAMAACEGLVTAV